MADLEAVHDRLKGLLAPYRDELSVTSDGPSGMVLEVPGLEGKPWGYVAATRLGKRYVSYYLMPVYASPELTKSISPELARRRQGKSCFNFTRIDEGLFAELATLTSRSIDGWANEARRIDAERR
jgi:hypothetical protein